MRRFLSLACISIAALGAGACGRSDLFTARSHHCPPGDPLCVEPDGGQGGDMGSGGNIGVGGSLGRGGAGGPGGRGGNIGVGGAGRGGTSGLAGRGGNVGVGGGGRGGTGGVAGRGGNVGVGGAGRGGTGGVAGRGGSMGGAGRGGTGGVGRGGAGGTCAPGREQCNNMRDDDCNMLIDCDDPACFGDVKCAKPGIEICNNNLDDDDDNRVDCDDPDCAGSLVCRPNPGTEICNNGIDDNANNLVDCSDPQCTTFPSCLVVMCTADVDFGTVATHGSRVTRTLDTRNAPKGYATCAPTGGVGRVGRFQLDAPADVRLDFSQPSGTAHVVGLYRAGANQACDRNQVDCLDAKDSPSATRTFPGLAAGVYWLIVESYPAVTGATTVTLSTGNVGVPEVCANGRDDDGNGLTDCQDAACVRDPSCVGSECMPDVNVGTLVVDGPAQTQSVDLRTTPSRYKSTCSSKVPGGDRAIAFTLAEPAGLLVEYVQSTGSRSIFALYSMPAPGLACDADQIACAFEDVGMNSVAFPGLSPGRYVFVVKAQGTALAGSVTLRLSAFGSNRGVEICANNIDDDVNGLTDCDDPACFGVGACGAPACVPDQVLGALSVGQARTVTIDTRGGGTLYQTSCSHGNGREQVIRLTLTQPMSLGFDCTDTGSHVLEIARQLEALDPCNAHEYACVDPATLPFGCGFSLPGLQPGQYNLIVQAFQSGNEGVVTLNLSGIREIIREICDNGIDDDNDGAVDCSDRKCVTAATCAKFACRPDQNLNLLPLDGTPNAVVVQTSMAGDDQKATMCASSTGGQDGDIDFQLPARADLTLEWAQVGDHDFALYSDEGALFACDAGTSFACLKSGGASTGIQVFRALPSGRYHLVVDADRPGREGGVVLQLSAVAAVGP